MIWHNRFAKLVAALTLLLIAAGGMVTITGSGLSVPDWPTTYGWNMFTFPLSKWVGGIRYEHFHRLVASTVGFLTIILAVWTWRVDTRRWVRSLGWACLGAVVLQGLLGGLTVLLKLPPAVSIGHAGLAQIFFCLTVTLALVTSPGWRNAASPVHDPTLSWLTALTTGLVYTQIILGATMRHTNAGMAIPTFPLVFGHLVPPIWNVGYRDSFRASRRSVGRDDPGARHRGARVLPPSNATRAGASLCPPLRMRRSSRSRSVRSSF